MSAPAFLSFPDLEGGQEAAASGPSAVPAFASFPDIDVGTKREDQDDKGEGPSKRRRKDDGEDRHRRRDERAGGRGHRRERDRESKSSRREHEHEARASRQGGEQEGGRSRRKEEEREREKSGRRRDGRERRRSRSRSRDRERERDRDHDKHDRRDRDRRERDRERDRREDRDRPEKRPKHDEKRARHDEKRESDERRLEKEQRRARDRERAEALKSKDPDDGRAWYESAAPAKPAASTASLDWFVDTVGDDDILRYREVATRNPPRYYRNYGGRIFGLPGDVRAVRSRDHKALEVSPFGRPYVGWSHAYKSSHQVPRYSSRAIDGSLHQARLLMRPNATSDGDLDADFLPLDGGRRKALPDAEDELPDYRTITKETGEDDPEHDDMVAVLGDLPNIEDDVKAKRAEYERELKARPDNVERWIKYSTMHLQDGPGAAASGDPPDQSMAPQTRANAEVTLSVLQRAFDAHRGNFASTDLHIAFLRAAEQLWPTDKVTERWKNVIAELGRTVPEEEMMKVYLAYMDWREGQGIGVTGGSAGGVDEVVAVYIDCIERLSGLDRDNEAREENQVYLLLRACLFLKTAGYTERALAVMQAAMEVTFFKPAYLRPPAPPFDRERWFSGVLMDFEYFWDSEVPRIGEENAQGWKGTHESKTAVEPPPVRPRNLDTGEDGDPYARWYRAERRAEQALNLPGRARDLDSEGDDPFHMIMFEDVAPFLFPVQTPFARLQLIYAFLTFLGLPIAPPEAPTSSPSASDQHLRWPLASNETLRASFWPPRPTTKRTVWQTVGGTPMDAEQPRTLRSPFGCPAKSWMSERGTLFASDRWFRDMTATDLGHVDVDFARNVLTLMRPLVPDPSFVLSTFAFEAAQSHKSAVKAAKSILAGDGDNLILWDGYARLEQQRGRPAAARQVYVTAIQAAEQRAAVPGVDKDDLAQDMGELWAAWAELEYESGGEGLCLQVLTMAAGYQREGIECTAPEYKAWYPSPITMLKARQHYATTFSDSPHQLVLGALFLVLTDGVELMRDRLLGVIDSLPAGHPQAEATLQLLVKIIFFHNSRHSAPASLMRGVLERAIELFPNNTIFLSLYLWGEGSRRVYGNVHRLTSRLISEDHGIAPLLWAVWAESQGAARTFHDAGGSGAERVRRALGQSVNSPKGRQCAGLWLLYIEFELLMGRPKAAKELCYRAMAAVGGCKELYLVPFSTLRAQFTSRELRDIVELMFERGIRVRVDTQEFWDHDHVTDDEEDESDDEMIGPVPDDYEYGMLREREVLKPY